VFLKINREEAKAYRIRQRLDFSNKFGLFYKIAMFLAISGKKKFFRAASLALFNGALTCPYG
jgi:hypothetical protein